MKQSIFCRKGTHQGFQHRKLGFNNQDGVLLESFFVPAYKKTYHIGIVCDGCTGLPGYSKTEVGGSLLPVFAYVRLQQFICYGLTLPELPRVLYQSCTEFIRDLALKIMPGDVAWDYPSEFKKLSTQRKDIAARLNWDVTSRFRADYLSATMLGFVSDEHRIVVFTSGDGVVLVNNELNVIEQDDKPEYMVYSINNPGTGFSIKMYNVSDVQRLAITCDGLRHLMNRNDGKEGTTPEPSEFCDRMFKHLPGHILGLQLLLNNTFMGNEDKMSDDCTGVILENQDFDKKDPKPESAASNAEDKPQEEDVTAGDDAEIVEADVVEVAPPEEAPATDAPGESTPAENNPRNHQRNKEKTT